MSQNINRLDKLFGVWMMSELGKRRPNFYGLQEFAQKINTQETCDAMGLGHQVNFAEGAPAFPLPQQQMPGAIPQQVQVQPVVDPLTILTESISKLSEKVERLTNHSKNQHNRLKDLEEHRPSV
jgi:hypothetical protein|tara:strand:- start:228 stop:599 length:372 start_codon:yes stop_codon:yes gene_type:complete